MKQQIRLVLKPGREKSLKHRHPWVFSGAVDRVEGEPAAGELIPVTSSDGAFLATAAYSPASQIRARAWSFDPKDTIDEAFLRARLAAAVERRKAGLEGSDACRLVHSESDGLPGLIADRYGDTLVLQLLSAGAEKWRSLWPKALMELTGAKNVYERSDAEVRDLEGLGSRTGTMVGNVTGPITITEDGIRYEVDVIHGQKTGFFLDQRENRALAGQLANGANVLNAFCYTGGFSLSALKGGAKHVVSLDTSAEALAAAGRNVALNGLDATKADWLAEDVFAYVRKLRDQGRQFDLIVLDPPKFAPTEKHVEKAARAYKDINLWAMKLLSPGGRLLTFSCSGAVSAELFQKIVAGAAADARADMVIERRLGASPDHPVSIHFPEGEYLKGLVLRKA
ncbi:23S rRNA methyltransferase [Betaproteobacteria bacterium GR16-43]|nr:23S rRNA methyltransferase [Betaproteobacteria bacterium GR16-43]